MGAASIVKGPEPRNESIPLEPLDGCCEQDSQSGLMYCMAQMSTCQVLCTAALETELTATQCFSGCPLLVRLFHFCFIAVKPKSRVTQQNQYQLGRFCVKMSEAIHQHLALVELEHTGNRRPCRGRIFTGNAVSSPAHQVAP